MRYRDLETGVFLTRDPIGYADGPNVYCYVHCNPITSFDATGLAGDKSDISFWEVCKAKLAILDFKIRALFGGDQVLLMGGPATEKAKGQLEKQTAAVKDILPTTPEEAARMAENPAGYVQQKIEQKVKEQVVKSLVENVNAANGGQPVVDEKTVEKVLDAADQVADSLNGQQGEQSQVAQSQALSAQEKQKNGEESSDVEFPDAKTLAKRLGVSKKEYERKTKQTIKKQHSAEMQKIGSTNPDVGVDKDTGNIVLKKPGTTKTIKTETPLETYKKEDE